NARNPGAAALLFKDLESGGAHRVDGLHPDQCMAQRVGGLRGGVHAPQAPHPSFDEEEEPEEHTMMRANPLTPAQVAASCAEGTRLMVVACRESGSVVVNRGQGAALTTALSFAHPSCNYIAFMESDDERGPADALSLMRAALD